MKKYVASFSQDPRKAPSSVSFITVKTATEDLLTIANLEFFTSVARQLQGFLNNFQTEAPMVPFLGELLNQLLTSLMSHFIKRQVMETANTHKKIVSLNLKEKKNRTPNKEIGIRFAAWHSLQSVQDKKLVVDLRLMEFCDECLTKLNTMTGKLVE